MSDIVDRLLVKQQIDTGNGYYNTVCDPLRVEAADLIQQQAERISELETGLIKTYSELVALRSKIENAEVVVWKYQVGGKVFVETRQLDHYHCDYHGNYVKGIPLIRKEDLLK